MYNTMLRMDVEMLGVVQSHRGWRSLLWRNSGLLMYFYEAGLPKSAFLFQIFFEAFSCFAMLRKIHRWFSG